MRYRMRVAVALGVFALGVWAPAQGQGLQREETSAGSEPERAAVALVPERGAYLGAYIKQDPVVRNDIEAFESLVGRRHASYLRYVGYGEPFPYAWVQEVLARGAMPQIAWEPNNGLAEVRDDAYLRGWAQAARHASAPIMLRYASEMNGDWMPYSGDPDEYIRKWRLVYRVMREVAPNVIMVWCPFGLPRSTIPLYYPGDEYVDWVGVNVYGVVYNDGDPNRPASDTALEQLSFVYNLYADRKPIAIPEFGVTHFCTAAQRSTTDFALRTMQEFYRKLQTDFPRVMYVLYFSVNAASDQLANNDYALTTNPAVLAAYREIVASPYFLSAPGDSAGGAWAGGVPQPGPTPTRSLPLEGTPYPGPREVAIGLQGASPRAVSGLVTVIAAVGQELTADTVIFYLDDRVRAITNVTPYRWTWDADRAEPGEHVIRVEVAGPGGEVLAQPEVSVIVAPGRPE